MMWKSSSILIKTLLVCFHNSESVFINQLVVNHNYYDQTYCGLAFLQVVEYAVKCCLIINGYEDDYLKKTFVAFHLQYQSSIEDFIKLQCQIKTF